MKRLLAVTLVTFLLAPSAWASFDAAMDAYRDGRFQEAFNSFLELAKEGDETAQFNVAVMYYRGEGVARDYPKAFAWMELAAQRGERENIFAQQILITRMSMAAIREGLALARQYAHRHDLPFQARRHRLVRGTLELSRK